PATPAPARRATTPASAARPAAAGTWRGRRAAPLAPPRRPPRQWERFSRSFLAFDPAPAAAGKGRRGGHAPLACRSGRGALWAAVGGEGTRRRPQPLRRVERNRRHPERPVRLA